MGCCGGIGHIVFGYQRLLFDTIGGENKYEFTDGRIRICWRCKESTWLTWVEYDAWIEKHCAFRFLRSLEDLKTLPKLPKAEYRKGTKLFCRLCKCFVPAAARVPEKKCPLGKW